MKRLLALALAILIASATGGQLAFGSCATDHPAKSPAAFTGVVTATRSAGRMATVRTDAGTMVEVVGTPATGSAATSVDRTYEVGGRYEFSPVNDTSPFQDNACTATRLLSMTSVSPGPTSPAGSSGLKMAALAALLAAAAAVAVAAVFRRSRQRARGSREHVQPE